VVVVVEGADDYGRRGGYSTAARSSGLGGNGRLGAVVDGSCKVFALF